MEVSPQGKSVEVTGNVMGGKCMSGTEFGVEGWVASLVREISSYILIIIQ